MTKYMKFKEAFEAMKNGAKVKLPSWGGYWFWDERKETIMMNCRPQDADEGQKPVLDIRETKRVEYTLQNILSDEWMIADETNCPILGGKQRLDFGTAFRMVKKYGKGMRLPHWKEDVVIRAQLPDEHSKMTAPYLYVESRFGRVPWKETMIELFSEDWEIVDQTRIFRRGVNAVNKPEIGDYAKCVDGYSGIVTAYGKMIFIIVPDGRIYHFPLSELADIQEGT